MNRKIVELLLVVTALLGLSLVTSAQSNLKAKVVPRQSHGSLKATATGHSATLNWVQGTISTGAPAVSGNNVYRGATSGTEVLLTSLTTPATTYVDSTVTAGSAYCYEVTAVSSAGESPKSNEVCVVTPNPVAPNAPTGLTATAQ